MARLHRIKVENFGPFDNGLAQEGRLSGLHPTLATAVRAGLDFNLDVLVAQEVFTKKERGAIEELFDSGNPSLQCGQSVLVHNDFADWNLLTDGKTITGILDWDECVGGDPISDIACWSTFFPPERLTGMLHGYWQEAKKPQHFEEKFELLRLRYTISKMTLRLRRYTWQPDASVREGIDVGKQHLNRSLRQFGIRS